MCNKLQYRVRSYFLKIPFGSWFRHGRISFSSCVFRQEIHRSRPPLAVLAQGTINNNVFLRGNHCYAKLALVYVHAATILRKRVCKSQKNDVVKGVQEQNHFHQVQTKFQFLDKILGVVDRRRRRGGFAPLRPITWPLSDNLYMYMNYVFCCNLL